MSKFKTIVLLGLSMILFIPAFLHAQLSVEGEFRPRTEYRNGYQLLRTPATEPAFFVSQRMRLSAMYESKYYTIKVAGQDVRVWGEVEQLQDNANLNIHEAWARVDLSQSFQLKMGRQELVYDDQRLLGSVNWTQQGRSHDALVAQYRDPSSDLSIDIGGAYNQGSENILGNDYTLSNYKFLSYFWLNRSFGSLDASAIFVTDGFEPKRDVMNYRYTYGTHLSYSKESWQLSGSVYNQQGDDAARSDISAYMFAINGSYSFKYLKLTAGYDYLSGGSVADENPTRHSFNTLYATNHKFYGHMDYFLSIPSHTRGGGLQDVYLGAEYNLAKDASVDLTYHHFGLANRVTSPANAGETLSQNLGSEFDLSFHYRFSDDVTLKVGYSTLIPTNSLDKLQLRNGQESQHWGWAMLRISPEIFQSD